MKNKIQALGVIALLVFGGLFMQSCEKIKDAIAFDVEQDLPAQNITLDSTLNSTKGPALLYKNSFKVNLDSIFQAHDISDGKISDSKFKSISLTIDPVEHPMLTYDFIKSVSFRLGLSDNAEAAVVIAEKLNIDPESTVISFDINSNDLSTYIDQKEFFFYIYGEMDGELPEEELDLIMKSTVKFTVNPLD